MNRLSKILVILFILTIIAYGFYHAVLSIETPVIPVEFSHYAEGFDVNDIELQDSILWIGGNDGIRTLNINSGQEVAQLQNQFDLKSVKDIFLDSLNNVWIGHFDGLLKFNNDELKIITIEDGLPDNRVNSILFDRDNNLWIGTWGGAVKIKNNKIEVIQKEDGLLDNMVNVIYQDMYGDIWFGAYATYSSGLSILADTTWNYFTTENGLPHRNITSIKNDRKGNVWIGTGFHRSGGAVKFIREDNAWKINKTLGTDDGLAGDKVRSIFIDDKDRIWFGFEYDGLTIYDNGKIYNISHLNGLIHPEVKSYFVDNSENMWVGTWKGLTKISGKYIEKINL